MHVYCLLEAYLRSMYVFQMFCIYFVYVFMYLCIFHIHACVTYIVSSYTSM